MNSFKVAHPSSRVSPFEKEISKSFKSIDSSIEEISKLSIAWFKINWFTCPDDAKEPSSNNNDTTTKKDEDNEPQPIQQKDIYNLTISQRLGYIAKSIISYAHWYPGLPELTLERLKKGSSHWF